MVSLASPLRLAVASALAVSLLAAPFAAPRASALPYPDGAPPGAKSAQKDKSAKAAAPGSNDSPFSDWSKVTKDATRKDGFFPQWVKHENMYWEIKKSQLKKPFLFNASYARGIGLGGELGGLPIADGMLQFERMGDHIFLIAPQTHIVSTGADTSYARAVNLSFGNSVLQSFKIESEKDSTVLIDMAPFLTSDALDITQRIKNDTQKSFRFDKERSAITEDKVFPTNTEVEALLTFSPNDRDGLNLNTVSDSRYVPLSIHYSFLQLPETPMLPRLADDRVGYFLEAYKDMSRDSKDDYWVRYINRWKLEKKDPSLAVSEPKEPIVYYIDPTIPVEWRPYVKAGIEEWNKAFEKAGFKNAIIARDAPADSNWDAEDARYSTIRWITSSEPSFGAIGPSQTDPRTGQILNADILIEGSEIPGLSNQVRRWVGPETVEEMMGYAPADLAKRGLDGRYACLEGLGMAEEGAFLNTALRLDGLLPPGTPVPKEYIGAGIKAVTMHEVGHTLGLRHNFKSSTAVTAAHLADKSWIAEHGLTGSIMDYDTPNIAVDPKQQVQYFSPTLGTYDLWAIEYGYTPSGAANVDDDKKAVESIARQDANPENWFGTDEDTYPADALDPRCNIFDLGDSPLAFSKQRVAYVSQLWKDPNLESKLMKDDDTYLTLRRVMDTLLLQYARGLSHARKYVGGQYTSRAHKGDPNAPAPFAPVPAAEQREAMDFLALRAFSPSAFDVPSSLLSKVGKEQNFDWGNNLFAYGRQDYPFVTRVFQIQAATLAGLMDPALLSRLREQETRMTGAFRLQDLFARLSGSILSEIGIGGVPQFAALDGPMPRRELQRAYVDRLCDFVANTPPGTPTDAVSLARLYLTKVSDTCQRDLVSIAPKSDTVRAHLMELRARARRALDAQRDATPPKTGPGGGAASPVSQDTN
jgi:hypothetical protein